MQKPRFTKLQLRKYIIGAAAVAIAGFIGVWLVQKEESLIFSNRAMMEAIWEAYKEEYIEESGRTLDKQRDNITTSEGQSYTMLRSVWIDDKTTFDTSWQWTKDNIQREEDNLFSWLFGEREDGTFGVLVDQGGQNTASDADTDIALALLFAYARWGEERYLNEARVIIPQIWEEEVIEIQGRPYLLANNIEKQVEKDTVLVNPSYFAPYAYRIFATVDTEHDWEELVDTSYEVLEASMVDPLDKEETALLPPDWIAINKETRAIIPAESELLRTNYSFDALRTPWRIALDYLWFQEERAMETLRLLAFLSQEWNENNRLAVSYGHDGEELLSYEGKAMYGGSIGYFIFHDKEAARQIYQQKLAGHFNPDNSTWEEPLGYYDDNWAWFGIGLYNDLLPNLVERAAAARIPNNYRI